MAPAFAFRLRSGSAAAVRADAAYPRVLATRGASGSLSSSGSASRCAMLGAVRAAFSLALIVLAGCRDASAFGPGSGRRCAGSVIGSDVSFIRRGFCSGTSIRLSFKPTVLEGCEAPDGSWEAMLSTTDGVRTDGEQAFRCAALRAISPLEHDALAGYQFSGGGRIENYIYSVARTDVEPICDGRDVTQHAVAFVSVLENGAVEVRLLAGSGSGEDSGDGCGTASEPVSRDLFGLFALDCS